MPLGSVDLYWSTEFECGGVPVVGRHQSVVRELRKMWVQKWGFPQSPAGVSESAPGILLPGNRKESEDG